MFELVERIEDYPQFLPVRRYAYLRATPVETLARIEINYHGVKAHFTIANRNRPYAKIVIELRDGPFRRLDGTSRFRSLAPDGCKGELELLHEFAAPVLARLIGPVSSHIPHTFIDAFVRRAGTNYSA